MVRLTKSPKGPVQRFTVSISPETAAKLERYCEKKDRQRSWVIDKLVSLHVDKLP
jgi:predicted transcriptional regulator